MSDFIPFRRLTLIGLGLIGSSIARAARAYGLAERIVAVDADPGVRETVLRLGFADDVTGDAAAGVADADLVVVCTPMGAFKAVGAAIGPHLAPGAILTDVGSVKRTALRDLGPHVRAGAHFVPGHPIAGTEFSGPEAGFKELFAGRWHILTPPDDADEAAVERLTAFWRGCGAQVQIMSAEHHDRVLAITSHLPHLIAFTIVGTAADMETRLQEEVIRYSASGFRDFTRIAASDPVMWRDIFLCNRDAVLEVLGRLEEDLFSLRRAIRDGDGPTLHDRFSHARGVRRRVIDAKQA